MERGHFQKNHVWNQTCRGRGGLPQVRRAPLKGEVGLFGENIKKEEKKSLKSSFPRNALHIQLHSLGCFITLRNIFKTDTSESGLV